jgi:hypothetical protein
VCRSKDGDVASGAQKFIGIPACPLVPFFLQAVIGNDALMLDDHIHPNAQGVEKIVAATRDEVAKALAADRQRMADIKGCDEAKGREPLAEHLALSGMSVDQAKGILAVSPKAEAKGDNGFKAHMDADTHPGVGANAGTADGGDKPNRVARLLQTAAAAGVRGYESVKKPA